MGSGVSVAVGVGVSVGVDVAVLVAVAVGVGVSVGSGWKGVAVSVKTHVPAEPCTGGSGWIAGAGEKSRSCPGSSSRMPANNAPIMHNASTRIARRVVLRDDAATMRGFSYGVVTAISMVNHSPKGSPSGPWARQVALYLPGSLGVVKVMLTTASVP